MSKYSKLESNPKLREAKVSEYWREKNIFEKSIEHDNSKPSYVWYEGPPTANGLPHFGHLLPRVYKDFYPRYKTMRGYYAPRKGGPLRSKSRKSSGSTQSRRSKRTA